MKTTTLRSLALLFLLAIAPLTGHAAAPANDKFEKATVLVPAAAKLLNQTGVSSTPDPLDPFIGGVKLARSVWYRFDADASSNLAHIIITDNAGVRAAVFQLMDPDGNAGTLGFMAQTNNTAGSDVEKLTFPTAIGKRYYVCIEANGLFDIKLQIPQQENDYFDDAIALPGDQGTTVGNNRGATNADDVPAVTPTFTPSSGVWYHWTPSFTGTAVLDTNFSELLPGTFHETVIAVFTGTTLSTLVNVVSDNSSGFDSNSRASFAASAGTTYRIWVGTDGDSVSGPFTLSYYPDTSPGVFELAHVPGLVSENQGQTHFFVRRFRAGSVAANVTVGTQSASATAGSDFTAFSTLLNFPSPAALSPSSVQQQVSFTVLPDNTLENTEILGIGLSLPSVGSTIGPSSPAQVNLLNAQTNSAPGFPQVFITVKENAGSVQIPVSRAASSGFSATRISTSFASNGTARAGADFLALNAVVSMEPGQTQDFITLELLDDGIFEGTETVVLSAAAFSPFDVIFGNTTFTVTIEDDDLPVPVPGRLAIVMDEGGISGSVDVTVSATGVVTGKVVLATGVFPFKGTLVNGSLTVRLGPATAPVRTVTIQLLNAASKSYRITLNDGETGTVASATVTSSNFTKLTPCPVAGTHTIADLGGFGTVPQLMAASIKVDVLGNAVISGKLFDGTPLIGSGAVDANNIVWIGCTLYKGKGRAVSAAILTATPQTIGLASFGLLRPGRANQASELPPIDALVGCLVARYIPPTPGQRVLQIWNPAGVGNADIDGGGFVGTVTKSINTSTANKVTVNLLNPEALKITLIPGTGFFSGTVLPPGSTKTKPIYGVLLQGGPSNGGGLGHFLNGTTAGKVALRGP